jgi:hypothetical protein
MVRRLGMVLGLVLMAGCSGMNPFAKEAPFVATAVPGDFAIVVDENHLTYYNRQHIQQVITAADAKSRTTYTTYRDFGNVVTNRYTQERAVTPTELQEMWDVVASKKLMGKTPLWVNWLSDTDLHQRNSFVVKIQADGQTRTYQEINSVPDNMRPLMLLVSKVRLQEGRSGSVPQVTAPETAPVMVPTPATEPATEPATQPGTEPATQP